MYFTSRAAAGKRLAKELMKYRYDNVAIIALSDGGVVVGAQVAAQLHCPLMLLLMQDITLPGERSALGVVDQNGGFTYNDLFSAGELEEFKAEYNTVIEQKKMEQWHSLNRLLGDGGLLNEDIARDRVVILISDGLKNGMSLQAAKNFLKPVAIKKLIVASPLATVTAVDRMHLLADELYVLSVIDSGMEIDHYFEQDDRPPHQEIVTILNKEILNWS